MSTVDEESSESSGLANVANTSSTSSSESDPEADPNAHLIDDAQMSYHSENLYKFSIDVDEDALTDFIDWGAGLVADPSDANKPLGLATCGNDKVSLGICSIRSPPARSNNKFQVACGGAY